MAVFSEKERAAIEQAGKDLARERAESAAQAQAGLADKIEAGHHAGPGGQLGVRAAHEKAVSDAAKSVNAGKYIDPVKEMVNPTPASATPRSTFRKLPWDDQQAITTGQNPAHWSLAPTPTQPAKPGMNVNWGKVGQGALAYLAGGWPGLVMAALKGGWLKGLEGKLGAPRTEAIDLGQDRDRDLQPGGGLLPPIAQTPPSPSVPVPPPGEPPAPAPEEPGLYEWVYDPYLGVTARRRRRGF